jgi:hypothetical protein
MLVRVSTPTVVVSNRSMSKPRHILRTVVSPLPLWFRTDVPVCLASPCPSHRWWRCSLATAATAYSLRRSLVWYGTALFSCEAARCLTSVASGCPQLLMRTTPRLLYPTLTETAPHRSASSRRELRPSHVIFSCTGQSAVAVIVNDAHSCGKPKSAHQIMIAARRWVIIVCGFYSSLCHDRWGRSAEIANSPSSDW